MSMIKIDSEAIAEVKNALCIISLNAEVVIQQIKRIDGLLPKVAYEEAEILAQYINKHVGEEEQ